MSASHLLSSKKETSGKKKEFTRMNSIKKHGVLPGLFAVCLLTYPVAPSLSQIYNYLAPGGHGDKSGTRNAGLAFFN